MKRHKYINPKNEKNRITIYNIITFLSCYAIKRKIAKINSKEELKILLNWISKNLIILFQSNNKSLKNEKCAENFTLEYAFAEIHSK